MATLPSRLRVPHGKPCITNWQELGPGRARTAEPFANENCRFANRTVFAPAKEGEDVAAALAIAETIPAVLFYTDPKLRWIRSIVKRTCTSEIFAILAAFELGRGVVMIENLDNETTCLLWA